jgi:hypothetical protein
MSIARTVANEAFDLSDKLRAVFEHEDVEDTTALYALTILAALILADTSDDDLEIFIKNLRATVPLARKHRNLGDLQ